MNADSLIFGEADFVPLADFSLRWRWLEANQHPMSGDELARIKPLTSAAATRAWEFAMRWHSGTSFDACPSDEYFPSIATLEDPHGNAGQQWLSARLPETPVPIIVSWQPSDAVMTDSALFAKRWEAFCYPASDDVDIWPVDSRWVVTYWHEEQLWFGER